MIVLFIFRLSGEVEEKNRTISQLEDKVKELEDNNRRFMDSVDAGGSRFVTVSPNII